MPPQPDPRWQHPWLRIQRLLRAMLTERWDPTTWQQVRREIPKALAERYRIKRAGWFNGAGGRRPVNGLIAAALTGTTLVACAGPKLISSRAGSLYRIDQQVPRYERIWILMRPLLTQTLSGTSVDVVFAERLSTKLKGASLYQDVMIMSPVSYFMERSGHDAPPPPALLVEATVDLILVPDWAWRMHPMTWGRSARARVRVSGTLSVTGEQKSLIAFSLQRAAKGGLVGTGGWSTAGEETMIEQLLEWVAEDVAAVIRKGSEGR